MFFSRERRIKHAILSYLRNQSHEKITQNDIEEEVEKIIRKKGTNNLSEQVIVALAVIAGKCRNSSIHNCSKETRDEAIDSAVKWLNSFLSTVAAMYLYNDITCLTEEGARRYFEALLERHYCDEL